MKFIILAPLLAALSAGRFVASPVESVVKLITELKATVEKDGQEELTAYDKYACWCEETLATKAADIAKAKTDIENMRRLYIKLGGELASLEVDIKQIKKDLAQNLESQKEAKEIRDKELEEYMEERTEAENCIGALEAAIKILTNAGTKSTKFLATLEEAQVLSMVGSLRGVLGTRTVRQKVPQKDLDLVRQFIENPDDYLKAKDVMVALQAEPKEIRKPPAGYNQDYAPQSGQIQGVLKQMYDDFTGKLEGANVEESKHRKAHEELMEVKKKEQVALEGTLQSSETAQAEKTSEHADTKSMLDLTQEQLEADEKFFAQTKDSCKKKAQSWAERTRLRAEELQGMTTAIKILSSEDAKKTFDGATTTFLQVSAAPEASAYKHLRALADKFGGLALAQVAAAAKAGGHFDKVINMIDSLIRKLKYEGEEDVSARAKCEEEQDRNKKAIEDLNFDLDKVKEKLERYDGKKKELQTNIESIQKEIDESNKTITEMKAQREKEWAEYSQATKDDLEAIQLLTEAIHSLSKFYKDNNIKTTALIQAEPDGVGDRPEEAAPETWEDEKYGGKKSESGGIIAILEMIKEDLEREVKLTGEADAAGRVNFASDLKAAEQSMGRQMKMKADADAELADVMRQIGYREEDKTSLGNDLDGEEKIKEALEKQCGWVETHFDERARKRKIEIEGLQEARHFLMGAVVLPGKR